MHLTIERLRTLVLAAGVLLVVALGVFLAIGRYKSHFNLRELPKRLGVNIQQEANGVTYSHALGAHSQFKVHASKAEQLKDGRILLHNVKIELYGQDGERVDRIEGDQFNYDQQNGTATAVGPVEITLMRPGVAPAIAPKATTDQALGHTPIGKPLASAAETAASGEIHVKTSGLTSNWNSGITTTTQRVDFSLTQGTGSSIGATYDSQKGLLVLDRDVELTTNRAGESVQIHAQHAEFTRDDMACRLRAATADYRGGRATAADANIQFREDGSAVRLDATGGFTLATVAGGHLAAPTGALEFDEHNQPQQGHLEGGVSMDSITGDRHMHGNSPTVELKFSAQGQLRHAHLERGVVMSSEAVTQAAGNGKHGTTPVTVRTTRTWHSQLADVDFRDTGQGQVEPATIHGTGGVVVTGESQRGKAAPVASKLAADEVTDEFGPHSALTAMAGVGHASIAETTATGDRETASGDRLEAHFAPGSGSGPEDSADQVQSATVDGHVLLVDEPAAKPGTRPQPPMRATAGRAVYEGTGQWLHLTLSPHIEDGAMQVSADKIDVSRQTGDAFGHGNVKATWFQNNENSGSRAAQGALGGGSIALGGEGPAHAIAQEAQIQRANDQATFKGHARLWQQDNSIAAPVIVLDREHKTLVAHSAEPADPVRVVLVSSASLEPAAGPRKGAKDAAAEPSTPQVVRVRGGDLVYSNAERKALMTGGSLGPVVAETSTATSLSNQVELFLLPAGKHGAGQGQVDRMIATGHVVLTSEGRRGTGEELTYTGSSGEYALTGTAVTPPRMSDPTRGTVTGEALIFDSRDDSVRVEGGGHMTRTDTIVRQTNGKSEPRN